MSNVVEDMRHITQMRGREDRIEQLPLPLVLSTTGDRQHTWPQKQVEVAERGQLLY